MTTPDINGQVGTGEWTDAPTHAVTFGGMPATVRFKHDATYLYAAITVTDNGLGQKSATFFFDDNHDGIKDPGEDAVIASGGGGDFYYSSAGSGGPSHYNDVGASGGTNPPGGGTNDVIAGATDAGGGSVTFEVRHLLCSADTVHDFCLAPGDTVGVQLQYQTGLPFFGYPGASSFDPSDWADLTLSAAPVATGRIVFESNRDGNLEIYRMNANGSAPTRLTENFGSDGGPALSPDGTKIAFWSDRNENIDIYVMNVDGSGVTRLTTAAGADDQPAFSPDGTKIAFVSHRDGNAEIYVMNADGTDQHNLTNNLADELAPSWSPDGTQIAFDSNRDENREIYRMNADGSGQTRITNDPAEDTDPDWSPDGMELAFVSTRVFDHQVFTMNVDGTGVFNVSGNPGGFSADPSWSPDGTRIAYVRSRPEPGFHFDVFTATAQGTEQVNLTDTAARNSFPDWGPLANPMSAEISISGPESSEPGAISAPIAGIPLDAIRGETGTRTAAPLEGIPLAGIPLEGIPLEGIPLEGIPLEGIGFTEQNLNQNGLGGVPLSTIPLVLPDKWEAHLALDPAFAGTPPQNVTLAQVLGTPVVAGISLDDLTVASSPLAGIPLAGIALGAMPLEGIPLAGIANSTPEQNRADWCAFINQQPGFTCPNGASLAGQTMLGLALQGMPLEGIPLEGIPLEGIPLEGIPLAGILVGTPLEGIPLEGIDLTGTPLGVIPLEGIDMAPGPNASPLAGIPLAGIPLSAKNAILNCPTGNFVCADTDTLGAAKAAGAIKPTAKLQDLGHYKDANGQDITLGDLVRGLPADTTLYDLLATVLLKPAYDWEALPLPGFPLQDFSADGGVVNYNVTFTLSGGAQTVVDGSVAVHLPEHARYVEGSTQISGSAGVAAGEPSLTLPENELTWAVSNIAVGTTHTLTFRARPGLSIGTETATAKIDATGLPNSVRAPSPASTALTEPGEPANGNPPTAQPTQADTLYLGYTSSGDDRDYFQVHADPGEQLVIHLSHLKLDADLVVYGPNIVPLRTTHPAGAPVVAGDVPFALEQRTQSITPEALTDVPQGAVPGQSVLDVSDNRGLADEEVAVVSPAGGTYTIQVAGFDGGFSNDPWMLRIEKLPALPLPANCTNAPATGGGVVKPMPVVPANASTLYLFASKRFGDVYGLQAENDVWNALQTLAGRTDAARGAVIPVDANTAVFDALEARATDSCSPAKANDVVRAVGAMLDNPQIVNPSVRYIVVVGDDAAGIPFGRILDNTAYANERGYASTFFGPSNNAYLSTYGLSFLPTDDPLGDLNYSGQGPYIPELSVSRLVDTPNQILGQLSQYVTRNGTIAPPNALTTGYDFLKDGSTRISSFFNSRYGANAKELINDSWSKTDLINAMFPASGTPPQIVSLNAHYDHSRSLPADENAAQKETILFTTADLEGRSTSGRVIVTMGCHSALPVSDFVVADPLKADWASAYAQAGAIVYAGNTGYGLGDTAAVLYTEKLNALFAERLDGSMTVGEALTFAKQEYGATPTQSGYHLKVIDQMTMMGLPMYRVGTGTTGPPPVPPITATDSATGLPTASFSVTPTFTRVDTAIGSFYTSDDIFAENRRPIQPTMKLDVTQPNGLVAHGALLTGLTSTEETGFDAAFSRVVDDKSAFTPELVGDVTYPTKLPSIASLATPLGTRQRLALFTGQFRSDGTPEALGIGIQRRFTGLAGKIFYANPSVTDFTPPTFGPVTVTQAATTVAFAVDVTDNVGGADGVKRVVALYRDASLTWKSIEMSHSSPRWSGAGPLVGTEVEWIIQAVDGAGNVGVTANKARGKSTQQPPPSGGLSAVATGPQTNGWFTGNPDPTVTITGPAGVGISHSLDGAPFTPGSTLTVSGTGVHTVAFQGTNRAHGTIAVPVDVSLPTVNVNTTYGAGEVAHADCADSGSGIAVCTSSPDPLNTTGTGFKTVHVHAEDRVGHVVDRDFTYEVKPYTFTGFFEPVDNPPVINVANAGNSIPVKFSLGAFRGLDVFAPGFPSSQPMSCSGGTADPIEETSPPGSSSFTYDPALNRYRFVWKTERSWRNTCRQLNVRLKDGVDRLAFFRFK